jgi:hypothetical protein
VHARARTVGATSSREPRLIGMSVPSARVAILALAACGSSSSPAAESTSARPSPVGAADVPEVAIHGLHAAAVARIPSSFHPDGVGAFTNGPIRIAIEESPNETAEAYKYAYPKATWSRDTADAAGWILVGDEAGAPVIAVWRRDVHGLCNVVGAARDQIDRMVAACSSLRGTGGPPEITAQDDQRVEQNAERVAEERLAADSHCPSGDRHRCDDLQGLVRELAGSQPAAVLADEVMLSSCKKRKLTAREILDWMGRTPIAFPRQVRCKHACCTLELGADAAPGDAGVTATKACFQSGRLVELETSCADRR